VLATIVAEFESAQEPSPFPAAPLRRTLPRRETAAGLEVFAGKSDLLRSYRDPSGDRAIYLWGTAVHPNKTSDEELLGWIAVVAGEGRHSLLLELLGHFVIVIDDRRLREVSYISDPLGVRPWFIGTFNSRLIAGSDVLGICDAGLSAGRANHDAVSSWLNYNFDCTGGSVVADYNRLLPGTIRTLDHAGNMLRETCYAPLKFNKHVLAQEELTDSLHEIVSRSFDRLTRGKADLNVPLSGGFDSRYLCALAAQRNGTMIRLTTVESYPEEAIAARQVAELLGLKLQVIPVGAHVLDLFDDPLAFGADGFPTSRNLTSAIARLYPGMPLVSGFMGDVLMRAPLHEGLRRFLAKDDDDLTDDQFALAAHERFRMKTNRLDLLRDHVSPHAEERAKRAMLRVIQLGRQAGRPLVFANMYLRHRLYFAAIFLGHIDVAEALLPFYSWELLQHHASHAGSFLRDNYQVLFRRHFPRIAHVPHDSDLKSPSPSSPVNGGEAPAAAAGRPTRHLRTWSARLLGGGLAGNWNSSVITPRKVFARAPGGLLGRARYLHELMFLHKIHAFEQRARRAGINLDWPAL
jgi:hypothetical protein